MSIVNERVNVGVVGATGVVGETFLNLLEERGFPFGELRLFASEASQGQTRTVSGREYPIQVLSEDGFDGLHLVFFSSGDDISRVWAPKAVAAGAFAVDNSAAFRMDPEVALIVPEINADLLPARNKPAIIANPNCSTIQLVVALQPLAKKYGLQAVRVATYQSVSGAGRNGIEELFNSTREALEGEEPSASAIFPAPIAFNCVPQIGGFNEQGFCTEEVKIMNETRKILRLEVPVSAFTVRVPTLNGHAEVAWVTLAKTVHHTEEIENCLASGEGLEVMRSAPKATNAVGQSPAAYPTQAMVSGRDPVYVGRIHRDLHDPATWLMWIVSDNLKKGAALNGIQIAERIFDIKPQ
ncbi:MAG: aspartate-semialdehyde dehydrogenase [Bdellovibrionaceae bacterium]|nr:aspartate-semialdehyde dehydrogenase [Pseudobdellovibrionaceae bacterium]